MGIRGPYSGGGSGGAGFALGRATNTFGTTAGTIAAARTARDTYATANSTWLAEYDDNGALMIRLLHTGTPGATFEVRAVSAWVDITAAIEGPGGPGGAQSRMVLFAYINTATAPTVAPTGGTFVRSTGVKTVPTGYTAAPVTPPTGQKTYRAEAVVNPAVDPNTVNLVWSVPAELPAYVAAALAEDAAEDAEAARDLAQQYAGQAQDIPAGSPRGALVATSPTLPTASTSTNSVIAFGASEVWTIEADAPDGFAAGPAASNERLYLPDIHAAGSIGIWEVVEVAGVEVAEVFISHGGIQGATGADRRLVLPVSVTADALIRIGFWPRSAAVASYLQLTGNSDTLPDNTVVKVYLAVVRGDSGDGGGGGGGGDTDLAVD